MIGILTPLVPPNPFLWIIAGFRGRFLGQQSQGVSPTSHQIGGAPTSLVLQRPDGTLIVNCPACVNAKADSQLQRLGFQIPGKKLTSTFKP